MLDLTKLVQFKGNNSVKIISVYRPVFVRNIVVEYRFADGNPLVGFYSEDSLENIPELKVIEGIISVHQYLDGEPYLTTEIPEKRGHSAKITYTEGAENPWQIEEVK